MKRLGFSERAIMGCLLACGALPGGSASAQPLTFVSPLASEESVSFTVVLPLRDRAGLEAMVARQHDPATSLYHHWLTPQEVETQYGPSATTIAAVTTALQKSGLSVTVHGHTLSVSGTASRVGHAFNTSLAYGRSQGGALRSYAMTAPVLPSALTSVKAVVLGLDKNIHEAHVDSQKIALSQSAILDPANRYSKDGTYWYNDLKQAYQFPSYQTMIQKNGKQVRLDGTGVTVGILMSADINDSDLSAVFNHEHFMANSGQASNPSLYKRVAVDGGATTNTNQFDEASLDTQQALTGAPGSHVILYQIPSLANSEMLAGFGKIIADNEADVVSASFGECELYFTAGYNFGSDYTSYFDIAHEMFLQGNAQGITFLASSGDNAGLECPDTNYVLQGNNGSYVKGIEWPASDPNVTAVGGTNLLTQNTSGSLDSTYVGENAYSDPLPAKDPFGIGKTLVNARWGAGGGLSVYFAKPAYQTDGGINTGSTGYRAVPDIGMQVGGCPYGAITPCNGGNSVLNGNGNTDRSAVVVSTNGIFSGFIGTSVAAPELAGAVAILIEKSGRQGNLNPYLYALGTAQASTGSNNTDRSTTVFHRTIPGYNGVVTNNQPVNTRGKYFNYTTGLGTPVVYRLVGMPDAEKAGVPQSASNP